MDGVTHINVYSKGRTALGRSLSNFARTPFELDGYQFSSVEAYWYWQSLWRQTGLDYRGLRNYSGFPAKKLGRELHNGLKVFPPSAAELKRAYLTKLLYNLPLAEALSASTLPFDHYYEWKSGEPHGTQWRWTGQMWNEIRNELCS